jgi:type IV pilus assembly protein PilA
MTIAPFVFKGNCTRQFVPSAMNPKTSGRVRGFTLIELMIVVAIVGILATIAIPAYQDYLVRSKVSELAATVAQCKTAVTEYLTSKSVLPLDLPASGCSSTATVYGTGMDVAAGVISLAATAKVGGNPDQTGSTYVLSPNIAGSTSITSWDCTQSTIIAKYLPAVCRT